MKKTPLQKIAEQHVKYWGGYHHAAAATGIAVGHLHGMVKGTVDNPRLSTLAKLGLTNLKFDRPR